MSTWTWQNLYPAYIPTRPVVDTARLVWVWLKQAARWFRQAMCGLSGHDLLTRFEPAHICLECSTCGYRTPGWELDQDLARRPFRPVATRRSPAVTSARVVEFKARPAGERDSERRRA
jgi:hypothetical protein